MPVTVRPPSWRRSFAGRSIGRGAALVAGGLVLVVALASPLRVVAESEVGAHMVQHLLLMSVAAPLLALAAGDPVRLVPGPGGRRWMRGHGWAVAVGSGVAYAVVLWGWHLPVLYDAAVDDPVLHAFEHLTMLGAGFALWSVIFAAGRGVPHQAAFAVLVPTAIHSAALGAILTFAPRPLYAGGAVAPDRLVDQQMAGTLMWGMGGVPFMVAAAVLVATWLRRAEARSRHRAAVRAAVAGRVAPVAVVVAVSVVGVACGGGAGGHRGSSTGGVVLSGADADAGRDHIEAYGCGACHEIPGVQHADAQVAPPLTAWSRRSFIAGVLPNEPENLARWIEDPHDVEPGTAMPDLGVDGSDARDIAVYLFSLD